MGVGARDGCRELGIKVGVVVAKESKVGPTTLVVEDNEEYRPGSLVPLSEKINQIKARNSVNMTGKKHI